MAGTDDSAVGTAANLEEVPPTLFLDSPAVAAVLGLYIDAFMKPERRRERFVPEIYSCGLSVLAGFCANVCNVAAFTWEVAFLKELEVASSRSRDTSSAGSSAAGVALKKALPRRRNTLARAPPRAFLGAGAGGGGL